ncbi:hypothetical protein ACKWTF_007269 [Chironomus riparius]
MISKFYRYRFLWITLLSLLTVVFIGNLYFKSVQEIQVLKISREDLIHKLHDIAKMNELVNNKIDVPTSDENHVLDNENNYTVNNNECTVIDETNATIKAVDMFSNFDFDADWVKRREGIWQDDFENRYSNQIRNKSWFPLKVFILPHSHTDPGWLQTFTSYYNTQTKKILDLVVEKLTEHQDMRFIWTEISFLDLWWKHATAVQQKALTNLVKSGRLEIMTGGWVMTDEANVHLYAMLDQLIEGHQWVKSKFDVAPKVGWSIDPFGQGSTVPHLLAKSGFDGAIIQRIHYNWKEWLARHQSGDFFWKTYWTNVKSNEYTLLTHNMPFDIYSTRHSCGPQPKECDAFDFTHRSPPQLSDKLIEKKADVLMQQYSRTASLFPHNVALVLMGSDFTFQDEKFFKNHYFGYKPIMEFINSNSASRYNGATVQYGTPSDYFNEIKSRLGNKFPTLIGDFFPYSDIFSSGLPAYWTGYFTTRPFHKFMSRDLEHNLRNAEILFTIVMNRMKQSGRMQESLENFIKKYENITEARRNLGLFQHHDAITGTSKKAVMRDYLERLYSSVKHVVSIQQESIEFLLQPDFKNFKSSIIEHELQRPNAEEFPTQKVLTVTKESDEKIVIFNSLVQNRVDVISVFVSTTNVKVISTDGKDLLYQINPIFDRKNDFEPSNHNYQLLFLAELPPLSLSTFIVKHYSTPKISEVTCKNCSRTEFQSTKEVLYVQNSKMKLIFDSKGFLSEVKLNEGSNNVRLAIDFGAYKSAPGRSGAYLFKPKDQELEDLIVKTPPKVFIVEGPIASEITVIYGELLSHTVRIFKSDTHLDDAILILNDINFEVPPRNRDIEMIMKIKTSIDNSKNGEPEFFTDENGFQWLPRRKVSKLGVEGNYYSITTSMFIQDDSKRLTLMTTHAQGATSYKKGELEVMLDRRTAYDDGRGMGEGVLDSVKMQHKFWLALEFFETTKSDSQAYQVPSLFSHHLINSLNYPANVYFLNEQFNEELQSQINLLSYKFSCDVNLVNLRSLSHYENELLPSKSSLLILHRLGHDCQLINDEFKNRICSKLIDDENNQFIRHVKIDKIQESSLTGLEVENSITKLNQKTFAPMEIKTYFITYQ